MLEFTDWAAEILRKANDAARRFNPEARIRLARAGSGLHAHLTDEPDPSDAAIDLDGFTLYAAHDLDGLVDIEEPHDRLVLKPAGASPSVRAPH